LSSSNFDYSKVKSGGSDLRFIDSDNTTELNYEIESWNSAGYSYVWVNVTEITASSSTDFIWLYYNNSVASDNQNPTSVWDHNYVGVWHLDEEESGTGNIDLYNDSTSKNNHGDDYVSDTGQLGQINGGQQFDGNGDYISVPHHSSLDLRNEMTISFWIYPTQNTGAWNRIVEKGLFGYQTSYYFGGGGGTNDLTFYLDNTEVFDTVNNVLQLNEWQHCAVNYSSNGDSTLFLNGTSIDSGNYVGGITGNSDVLYISFPQSSFDFPGYIDEVRISNIARSGDYIRAQNLSMSNNFITFEGEEGLSQGPGVAYIFFGYSVLDISNINAANANVTIYGNASVDLFGWSVSDAGDVNGDNIPDVIIGAPGNNSSRGGAYIFYGRGSWNSFYNASDSDVNLSGENAGDEFGYSVSGAGNIDNSDDDDVIIGAPNYGGENWWNVSWKYRKKLTFDNSGQSESLENFPVLVNLSSSNFDYSKALSNGSDLRFIDNNSITELKYHIEDWDISGYSYVWVNVTNITANSATDYIWMYYNNSDALNVQDVVSVWDSSNLFICHFNNTNKTIDDESPISEAGTSFNYGKLAQGIDISGTDYLVYDATSNINPDTAGTIEFWFRAESDFWEDGLSNVLFNTRVDTNNRIRINNPTSDDLKLNHRAGGTPSVGIQSDISDGWSTEWHHIVLTWSVSTDELKVFIDGAQLGTTQTGLGTWAGTLTDFNIGSNILETNHAPGIYDEFRISNIARSPNWVKAQYLSMNNSFMTYGSEETKNRGRAYVFNGDGSIPTQASNADVILTGEANNDFFGFSVSNAGDVNNTGFADVIVGAPGTDSAYIFCGNASMDNSISASNANVTLTGTASTNFGWSVSNCSDINSDGSYDDVIVGAPDSSNGNAYIFHGGASMDSGVDVTLSGEAAGDKFGYSVSWASDIDGDGDPDVIIGAPFHTESGKTDCGALYAFRGGSGMDSTADVIRYGENAGDRFGWSVDGCFDINKDGKKDTVIGAPYFGAEAGKTYIMHVVPEFPILILPILILLLIVIVRKKNFISKRKENR
jgi:hypothetical protein